MIIETGRLLSAAELSEILGIRESTVKRLAKEGELPCVYKNKRLLFDLEVLYKHFENMERGAA